MHVIVLGSGRIGSSLALRLDEEGHSVSIVDRDREAFRRLPERFTGRAVLGSGYDRDVLEQAGIHDAGAVAAVMYGDNSNIVAARIAKETYEIPRVVARIKDPRRAEIFQRLGIPTVAMVTWTTDQVRRRLLGGSDTPDWTDASGTLSLVDRELPDRWAGHKLDGLHDGERFRLVAVSRAGTARLATPALIGQEGDVLHLMVHNDAEAELDELLAGVPEGGH
ncbi:MAG TPA: TrkA family potassium uptake protein [Acidimicrobiales bacterium]|nr:TrkA family potassium uptake protein [Acidimicrobiales bacterium]